MNYTLYIPGFKTFKVGTLRTLDPGLKWTDGSGVTNVTFSTPSGESGGFGCF